MKPINPQVWASAADDVLSVLVTEQYTDNGANAFSNAVYEQGILALHVPPGRHRALLRAIMDLRFARRAVTWNAIAELAGGAVSQQWYAELCTLCDAIRIADFHDNVSLLKTYGERMIAIESLEQGAANLRAGEDIEQTISNVVSDVTSETGRQIKGETAVDATKALRELLKSKPEAAIPTGIDFIDEVTGGIRKRRMMVIAGAYKSRKTTIAYNMTLNAARNGMSPALLSLENTIATMNAGFVSMLAVDWLLKSGKVPYARDASAYWISPDALLQAGEGYKNWTKLKVDAIEYALDKLEAFGDKIRFYDTSTEGGALSDMSSIRRVVKRDMHLYGGDLFVVDHQGLVDAPGEIYEHTRSVSKDFQRLSRLDDPHPISLVVIAQLNESAIQNGSGYSAGVKGGGDTSANVDYLITTTPVAIEGSTGDFYDDRTEVKVKFNRWGGTTPKKTVMFHPESGLLMKSKTIDLKEYSVNGSQR